MNITEEIQKRRTFAILSGFMRAGATVCVGLEVHLGRPREGVAPTTQKKPQTLSAAARFERVSEIEFSKSRDFHYARQEDRKTGAISLDLKLGGRVNC